VGGRWGEGRLRRWARLPAGQLGSATSGVMAKVLCVVTPRREICVVTCVVTLPSLPLSEGFTPCRSGTGEGQGGCVGPA